MLRSAASHRVTPRAAGARRARIAPAAVAAVLLSSAGCGTLHRLFPTRDEIYKPIPVEIGEAHLFAGRTWFVVDGPGYSLASSDRDALPDFKTALDQEAATFTRYVRAEPAVVTVALVERDDDRLPADSAAARRAALDALRQAARDSGRALVVVPALGRANGRARREMRMRGPGVRAGGSLREVERAWYAAWVRSLRGGPADSLTTPAWVADAVSDLVAGGSAGMMATRALAEHPDRQIPFRTLFAATRRVALPAPDDSARPDSVAGAGGGSGAGMGEQGERGERGERGEWAGRDADRGPMIGRGGAPSSAMAARLEAASVAEFLIDREGIPFFATVARRVVAGTPVADALAGAQRLPSTLDELETAWRGWLAEQARDR